MVDYNDAIERHFDLWRDLKEHGAALRVGESSKEGQLATRHDAMLSEWLGQASSGETFFWDASLLPVVEGAADVLKDWRATRADFPCPNGYMLLGRTVALEAPAGSGVSHCQEFLWSAGDKGCVMFWLDSDTGETIWQSLQYGAAVHENFSERVEAYGFLLVKSMLAFMEQRIVVSERRRPSRATRRRLGEEDGPTSEPLVNVIQLRRHKQSLGSTNDDAEAVEWQCQWLVRGHWRQQWYAAHNQHRPVWITPYVKGPEGKPLKMRKRDVFAVVR